MARVLIVDDEAGIRSILRTLLAEDQHQCSEASSVQQALAALESQTFDVVLTDQRMPDGDGRMVVLKSQELDPNLPVIMLTAYATVELAVQVMREGTFDVLTKPFEPEHVRAVVRRAAERVRLHRENLLLRDQVKQLSAKGEILGNSPAIEAVRERIARVAPTHATVLITGETGTGKELAARAIHKLSSRSNGSFSALNCAALPESLLESELFGHERGAFTGADRARAGLFESADGGTLLLDEAGEMSLALQAKLLRVLADGQVQRVGSRASKKVDVRLLLATHRDLQQRVKEGLFREDLFYRVAVVPLAMPPLRERLDDLPLLIQYFLQVIARDINIPQRDISAAAIAKLSTYTFPGNIRELRNLLERAAILAQGNRIEPNDFPLPVDARRPSAETPGALPASFDLREFLEQTERHLLERVLRESGDVQAEAARRLCISRSDLNYKMKKYNLSVSSSSR